MSVLVYAEHDNATLNKVTLSVLAAAKEIGGDITVLVAGKGCGAVAEEAQQALQSKVGIFIYVFGHGVVHKWVILVADARYSE